MNELRNISEFALTDGFVVTIRRKPELALETVGGITGEVGTKSAPSQHQVGSKSRLESSLAAKILFILKEGELGKSGMASELGHKTVSGELHKQVKRLQTLDLIEMTIPDKPNSRLQKYRLTGKGESFLEGED